MFSHHKKLINNFFVYSGFLIFLLNIFSCKKSEFTNPQMIVDRQRFFNLPENSPQLLQRIISDMKMQDAENPFVEDFIKTQGYPNWKFAKISLSKPSYNSIEPSSDTLVSVPIVQNGKQYLKSVLAIKLNTDVWYKLLDGIKYRELPNEETGTNSSTFTTAEFLKLMMEMESKVFGQNNFKITDTDIAINSASTGGWSIPNYGIQVQFANGCTVFNYGFYNDGTFTIQSSETVCLYETGVLNYTLTVPETGGEGGGGGSNSGSSSIDEECERGFIGITGFGNGGIPLYPCPIITEPWDSIPSIISQKCSNQMDSLYQWGMTHNFREQSFIVVKKNGNTYAKNFLPGTLSGDQTKVNYSLESGEILLAYGHIHAEDTNNFYRTAFSAEDLIEFNKHANAIGYTAILEVGNARYAFVLENIQLKNAFNISRRGNHRTLYNNILDSLATQITNGQTCTEQAWIEYLGSAISSGIGFYKASTPDKNTFIKLN